ncbi:hypothetical protein T265_00080 [Opisthorchis viverrini]|uniref:Uncharacterized protein n=1 Tax=Opisthorchis viverrini TaxID=6198 RepID=A0A075A3I6_OPIVI|nr:hypothetical protein T265_00080 [Opisthorchis viverrini]KER34223.1 hypothetical protein T265_00080 [Opisthorchis viverrini]
MKACNEVVKLQRSDLSCQNNCEQEVTQVFLGTHREKLEAIIAQCDIASMDLSKGGASTKLFRSMMQPKSVHRQKLLPLGSLPSAGKKTHRREHNNYIPNKRVRGRECENTTALSQLLEGHCLNLVQR